MESYQERWLRQNEVNLLCSMGYRTEVSAVRAYFFRWLYTSGRISG